MTIYTLNQDTKKFPGGEIFPRPPVKVEEEPKRDRTVIRARLTNSDQIMALLMLCDSLRRSGEFVEEDNALEIPYFPYARQDRVANSGDSLGAAVMADLINGLGFQSVRILDPHSDVTSALVENVVVVEPHTIPFGTSLVDKFRNGVFIVPDAGAAKKTRAFAKYFENKNPMLEASKVRNTETGQITETVIHDNVDICSQCPYNFVIVDDICDGGRTFIELAKVLREDYDVESLHLHVSHGIFSKGVPLLLQYFDTISTTDSFLQNTARPNLTTIKIF